MSSLQRRARTLRCRYHVAIRNVIGHNESLPNPYHREDVPSLRSQTHSDFAPQTHSDFYHTDMEIYRRRLVAAGGCT